MRRLSAVVSLFTVLFFVLGLAGNVLITNPTFSNEAFAQQKNKVVKKTIKKKLTIKKTDGKITIKKKVDIRKVVKRKGGGNNGIPKQIRKLKAQINDIQQQIDNLEGGVEGPQGEQGDPGPQGPIGPIGATGAAGAAGADGTNGVDGTQGPVGPAGNDGATGVAGADGTNGVDGTQGPAGPAGANGIDGLAGAIGPQGPIGPIGPPGPQGPQGQVGFQGPQGDTGPQGPQGNTGLTGPAGPSGANTRPILYSGYCRTTRSGITGFHRYCLDATEFNTAGSHLIASPSGIMIARVSGYYRITAHTLARSANLTQARVIINGVSRHYQRDESGGRYIQSKVDVIYPIVAGQNFWVEFFSANLEAFLSGNLNSKLQVTFLGPLN